MLLAPRSIFVVPLTFALASGAFAQCAKDTDCKGDRVCVNGTCTDPSTKPAASTQPAAGRPPSSIAPCKVEAPDVPSLGMRAGGQVLSVTYMIANVDSKTGGFMANWLTSGISKVKARTLLRIDKARASLRIQDRQPQFLDIVVPVGASPDNMYVVRLTPRDNARFLQIGSSEANAVGASSSSYVFPDGIRVAMTPETLSTRCTVRDGSQVAQYRLKPEQPLANGEYAFLVGMKLYDFGVDSQ
jgi:hypothetical protein